VLPRPRACRARTGPLAPSRPPLDITGAAAQTPLMDVRQTGRWTRDWTAGLVRRGTEERGGGLLTVCRLNVLGPLLEQLTYCLCGRQAAAVFARSVSPFLCSPLPFRRSRRSRHRGLSVRVFPVFPTLSRKRAEERAPPGVCVLCASRRTILYDGCFRKHAYLFVLSAGCGHQPSIFWCAQLGRQLKIDAPLSPTIFLPIFVFKFASGYAAPPVCSVGVILTAQRGLGDLPAGGSRCIFFSLSLFVSFFFIFICIYIYIYVYIYIYICAHAYTHTCAYRHRGARQAVYSNSPCFTRGVCVKGHVKQSQLNIRRSKHARVSRESELSGKRTRIQFEHGV